MPLFWWLLFTHFMADFPLQTNKIYSLKLKRLIGVVIHASIFGIMALVVSVPYWLKDFRILMFVVFLWISHFCVDRLKLRINKITTHKTTSFIIDQLVHIVLISLVFLIPHKHLFLTKPLLVLYYYNPIYIIIITAYLIATYVSLITRLVIREGRLTPDSRIFQFPSFPICIWEMIERAAISTGIWLGNFYYLLLIIGGVSVYIRYIKKIEDKYNLIISTSLAILVGIGLKLIIYLMPIKS